MDDKNKIYLLNEDYYNFLLNNKLDQMREKPKRPYIGFIKIKSSKYDYIIPLTSQSHKYDQNNKYSIPILINGKAQDILLINKMIPILNNEYFINEINKKSLSLILKKELSYLNKFEIKNEIISLANEAIKKQDWIKKDYNINFNIAENLCKQYSLIIRENKVEIPQEQVKEKRYFTICLLEKNIKNENEKNYLISIKKIGLLSLRKNIVSFFETENKNTRKMCSKIKVSFAFDHKYILSENKQGTIKKISLNGEELFKKIEQKELSKEMSVGLKLLPKNLEVDEVKIKQKMGKGMGM